MTSDIERLNSVIVALKSVRQHVSGTFEYYWPTRIYNRWIEMLGDAQRLKAKHLRLRWFRVEQSKFRLRLDATIAFLEQELAALKQRENQAPPLTNAPADRLPKAVDAEFKDITPGRSKFWPMN
jgi:hypothetical protein